MGHPKVMFVSPEMLIGGARRFTPYGFPGVFADWIKL